MNAPERRIGQLIRSTHRHAFRSGQWGRIDGVTVFKGRLCYFIRWNEGTFSDDYTTVDMWPVEDPVAGYEFAQVIP